MPAPASGGEWVHLQAHPITGEPMIFFDNWAPGRRRRDGRRLWIGPHHARHPANVERRIDAGAWCCRRFGKPLPLDKRTDAIWCGPTCYREVRQERRRDAAIAELARMTGDPAEAERVITEHRMDRWEMRR